VECTDKSSEATEKGSQEVRNDTGNVATGGDAPGGISPKRSRMKIESAREKKVQKIKADVDMKMGVTKGIEHREYGVKMVLERRKKERKPCMRLQ